MTSGPGSGPGLMLTEHLELGVIDSCPRMVGSQVQEPLPMGDGRV